MTSQVDTDTIAIARLGASVRSKLEADPLVQKVPVEGAEMFAADDFLSASECQQMAAMVDRLAQPSRVFDPETQRKYRTSYSSDVDTADPLVRAIDQRISDLLGIEPSWGESVQGQRYTQGQEFHAHHDWFHAGSDYWAEEQARGGQRSWTAMAYLNDVEEGGETAFPHLGISIAPQAGMLLMWNNALPNGLPNEHTLHAALPVIRGRKFIITKWFRARPWC
jgi:prolyl 4-hydroxylase